MGNAELREAPLPPQPGCQDVESVASKKRGQVRWIKLVALGVPVMDDIRYRRTLQKIVILLQPGYEGIRHIDVGDITFVLHVKIVRGPDGPLFIIEVENSGESMESNNINTVTGNAFRSIGFFPKRKTGGLEFFGFNRNDVMELIKYEAMALKSSDAIGEFFDTRITIRVWGMSGVWSKWSLNQKVILHVNFESAFGVEKP